MKLTNCQGQIIIYPMATEPTIDFSTYPDKQLLASLSSINRDKFEHNYVACKSEIEKRKANGTWGINDAKEEQESIFKARKIVKIFALIQAIGGVLGIGNYLYMYGPHLFTGEVSLINWILLLIVISLFAFNSFVSWKYWRTQKDHNGLWRLMIGLQVPAFCIRGFGYEFYSGFKVPLGYGGQNFGINASLGSNASLFWNDNAPFAFYVNIGALILLGLLTKAELFDKNPAKI